MRVLQPAERLIVAADFPPTAAEDRGGAWLSGWVRGQVLTLAEELKDTGVCLKVESALRICGFELIDKIHQFGLRCMVDLKYVGIPETLAADGAMLHTYRPEFVTAFCSTGKVSLHAFKAELPETEVLGVTVLSSLDDRDCLRLYGLPVRGSVEMFASVALSAGLDGLVAAPAEANLLRDKHGDLLSINVTAVRPDWVVVSSDDQNLGRSMTPTAAICAGAHRVIVGRPITQEVRGRRDRTLRIIEEIATASLVKT